MQKGVAKMSKRKPLNKSQLGKKLDEAWSLSVKKRAGKIQGFLSTLKP